MRLLSQLTKTLEVEMELSKGPMMAEEGEECDHLKLDREALYEALIDSVMRLLLHVQDMLAQKSSAHESSSADDDVTGNILIYVCMYIYIYVCIYVYVYVYMYNKKAARMNPLLPTTTSQVIYLFMYICIYVHICIYVYEYVYMYNQKAARMNPLPPTTTSQVIYLFMYICIYIYVYMYMYMCICITKKPRA